VAIALATPKNTVIEYTLDKVPSEKILFLSLLQRDAHLEAGYFEISDEKFKNKK
jgi:hypothetical protein